MIATLNSLIAAVVILQLLMAACLVIVFRNGRSGREPTYVVASERSHPYQLGAVDKPVPDSSRLYEDIPIDRELLELDKRALTEAYHAQLLNLWAVWLKGQAGDPQYFTNGLKIARRAYKQASEQIAKREAEAKSK